MSVTRAFMIACAKSSKGNAFLQEVLNKAGLDVSFSQDNPKFGLEVVGGKIKVSDNRKKAVLCISPNDKIAHDDVLAGLYSSDDASNKYKHIVRRDAEQPDRDKLKKILTEDFPGISDLLANKNEVESETILNAAWWDIWRLQYAGSRVDALIQNSSAICLIESKIWGSVYEIQARNHSQEFFGTTQVTNYPVSWQSVYDIAVNYHDDTIISHFAEYLAEFPQLVRWNGYDASDMRAFEMNAGSLEPEPALQNRLQSHYWQSMEDLCSKFDYTVQAKRGYDWDFTPKNVNLIGNTGIGYWGGSRLSVKWCVGYHAWEMDEIMKHSDLVQRGKTACGNLATALKSTPNHQGLWIEIRAVQRFQYANAMDGTWFDGSSMRIWEIDNLNAALEDFWKKEVDLLMSYHSRRGKEVVSSEALIIKQDIFKMRHPDEKELPESMTTKHKTWQLFAALDVFIHIEPHFFTNGSEGQLMSKAEQLTELNRIVNAIAQFAEAVSK
jgi:hypothetical protein